MHDGAAEAELLLKAGQGDEAAFLLLYERHRTAVFRFACRMLGCSRLAEDVTQECFLSILKRPGAFRAEQASLRTYLCAIARHLALKQLRRQGQETLVDELPEEASSGAASPDELRRVIDEEAAEAVLLFEYEEMSLAQIAAVCESDVGTVKSRLHRARERLHRTLAPFLAGGRPAAVPVPGRKETRP